MVSSHVSWIYRIRNSKIAFIQLLIAVVSFMQSTLGISRSNFWKKVIVPFPNLLHALSIDTSPFSWRWKPSLDLKCQGFVDQGCVWLSSSHNRDAWQNSEALLTSTQYGSLRSWTPRICWGDPNRRRTTWASTL